MDALAKGPPWAAKQVAGLDVERGPLLPGVQQQVQQQQVALAPREARAVGLRQADVPQRQRQDAQRRPVIPQLHARPVVRPRSACKGPMKLRVRGCLIPASADYTLRGNGAVEILLPYTDGNPAA